MSGRAGRRVRVSDAAPGSLQQVESRRRQLLSLALIVLVLVAAGVVLFSIATGEDIGVLDLNVLRASFVALAVVFALYVWMRERDLRRAEGALIESRLRAAGLTNRLRELSDLSRAGRELSSILSLGHVLEVVLDSARELLGATEGSVMLLDEDGRHLRMAASMGLDEEVAGTVVPIGEGIAGWVAANREPVIVQGAAPKDRFPHFVTKSREVRSAISLPLYGGEDPVGVLNVSITEDDRRYTEHDLEALQVFADHAGVAIANARAYESEREGRQRLAEIDASRREFIATLSHDLKAPLTSILGYAKLLTRVTDFEGDEAQDFVHIIERQGRRILDMVEQLVVATKLEESAPTLTRERLDLGAVIEDQVEAMRGVMGGRHIEVRVPDELPVVWGDRSAVEHCLINLLDNAVKYSPDPSAITVEVLVADGELLLSVTDEGRGIPEDLLPDVFERYQRATDGGDLASVGLGLFIVRSLSQAQGGRAWAENEPGKGARVTFTLPYRKDRD